MQLNLTVICKCVPEYQREYTYHEQLEIKALWSQETDDKDFLVQITQKPP